MTIAFCALGLGVCGAILGVLVADRQNELDARWIESVIEEVREIREEIDALEADLRGDR